MVAKHIVLSEENKILWNEIRSIIISENPSKKTNDNIIVAEIFKFFKTEKKNGRNNIKENSSVGSVQNPI